MKDSATDSSRRGHTTHSAGSLSNADPNVTDSVATLGERGGGRWISLEEWALANPTLPEPFDQRETRWTQPPIFMADE